MSHNPPLAGRYINTAMTETAWGLLMILKLDMPYDSPLGFIGVSKGNETSTSKDSNPTLIAAPITIAKSWEAYK